MTLAIPLELSSFVGRSRDLEELTAFFAAGRLAVLTGAGGSGKTRLAVEFALEARERFPGGVYFVDLAAVRGGDVLVGAIAAAVGLRPRARQAPLDALVEFFGDRHALLVLDNLEQLPGAAGLIAVLLGRCASLRVMGTSRARLHLRGEHVHIVHPLGLPEEPDLSSPELLERVESVALFVDRARATDAGFCLSTDNAATIAGICRRVDGLPLAIELAAARLNVMSPEALLERLDHALRLLTIGAADAPVRQRTLRDTIAWSYDLLDPADRALLAGLSVFSGGFTTPAAIAVAFDATITELDALEALGRLVDRSLLRVAPDPDRAPRFVLLDTIREFAREQLRERQPDTLRRRHAEFFTAMGEDAARNSGGPDHEVRLRRVNNDNANLRAAVDYATHNDPELLLRLVTALGPLFVERGDHREAGEWFHAAEARVSAAGPELRATFLFELAKYEIGYAGDRDRLERLFSESLRLYESLDDTSGMARALVYLANVAADVGDGALAIDRLNRAQSLAPSVRDPLQTAQLLEHLAVSVCGIVGPSASGPLARQTIEAGMAVGRRSTVATGLMALGCAALISGDTGVAIGHLSQAAEIFADLRRQSDQTWAMTMLGTAHLRAGDIETARVLLRDATEAAKDAELWIGISAIEGAAELLGKTGRHEVATTCWAAVDAARAASRDRTFPSAPDFFTASRERGRSALPPAAFQAARDAGEALSLPEAIDYARTALEEPGTPRRRGRYDLTPRERTVLELVARGRSDAQIAEALFISKKTASVHVANIKGKLGVGSRVEIATTAIALPVGPANQQARNPH